jgi:hypothetical protein
VQQGAEAAIQSLVTVAFLAGSSWGLPAPCLGAAINSSNDGIDLKLLISYFYDISIPYKKQLVKTQNKTRTPTVARVHDHHPRCA